jgi:class 3 adenylate cyclase/CheY-like chemotaxis protein
MELSPQAPACILVVDDTEELRTLLSARLEGHGYCVIVTDNGQAALDVLAAQPVDLVLLDVMMPGMDGVEVLTRIKQDPGCRHIPVVMISALTELAQVARCITLGAEDYLTKPFNGMLLKARVESSLVKKRWRDQEQTYLGLIEQERQQSDRLLLNVLPAPIAARLKRGERVIADAIPAATVLFADLVGFTSLTTRVAAGELIEMLSHVFSTFDVLAAGHGLEKIKTMGDAYMLAGGVPLPRRDHALAVGHMAVEMQQAMAHMHAPDGTPLRLRVGIHTGPLTAGVLGTAKFSYDIWGDTVNVASRLTSLAEPGAIQVSDAARVLLEEAFIFQMRGKLEVKGKGAMAAHVLTGPRG